MPSYLDGGYLADLMSDLGDDVGAENATSALTPAPGEPEGGIPAIRLPGGIIMRRDTFYLLLTVAVLIGIYLLVKRKKPSHESD